MLKEEMVVGKLYVVKDDWVVDGYCKAGDVIEYIDDDCSDYPKFRLVSSPTVTFYCYVGGVEPYTEDRCIPMEQKQAQELPESCCRLAPLEAELPNPHYQTDIQPIEFMQANMTPEAFQGYLRGNIMKYTARIGKKDESLKEAKKIADYSRWLVLAVQGIKIDPRKD